jgi:hypothetical protein
MKYQIQITYKTGNSYGKHTEQDIIEIGWDNIDVAKANIKRIKEHYKQYKKLNSHNSKYHSAVLEENKDMDWFVYEPKLWSISTDQVIDKSHLDRYAKNDVKTIPDFDLAEHSIKLYTDDGNVFQMGCYWLGYFEQLISAKIIMDEVDDELEFEVD